MDPHATWKQLQEALVAENWDIASELAEALLAWLNRNGFPPLIGTNDLPYGWHRALAEAGAKYVLVAAAGRKAIAADAEIEEEADRGKESQP